MKLECMILIPLPSSQQVYGNTLILCLRKKIRKIKSTGNSWWLFSLIVKMTSISMLFLQKLIWIVIIMFYFWKLCNNIHRVRVMNWQGIGHSITIMLARSLLFFCSAMSKWMQYLNQAISPLQLMSCTMQFLAVSDAEEKPLWPKILYTFSNAGHFEADSTKRLS